MAENIHDHLTSNNILNTYFMVYCSTNTEQLFIYSIAIENCRKMISYKVSNTKKEWITSSVDALMVDEFTSFQTFYKWFKQNPYFIFNVSDFITHLHNNISNPDMFYNGNIISHYFDHTDTMHGKVKYKLTIYIG